MGLAILDPIDDEESFKFFALPAEIRDQILDYVATGIIETRLDDKGWISTAERKTRTIEADTAFMNVALVSHRMYEESERRYVIASAWTTRIGHALNGPREPFEVGHVGDMIVKHARTWDFWMYFDEQQSRYCFWYDYGISINLKNEKPYYELSMLPPSKPLSFRLSNDQQRAYDDIQGQIE